jgi:hypothetical protein
MEPVIPHESIAGREKIALTKNDPRFRGGSQRRLTGGHDGVLADFLSDTAFYPMELGCATENEEMGRRRRKSKDFRPLFANGSELQKIARNVSLVARRMSPECRFRARRPLFAISPTKTRHSSTSRCDFLFFHSVIGIEIAKPWPVCVSSPMGAVAEFCLRWRIPVM